MIGQHELDFEILLTLIPIGHIFEVTGFGNIEICPHDAVVRQGRKDLPSKIRLPCWCCRRPTIPSKGALTVAKSNSAAARSALAWAFSSLALRNIHLVRRNYLVLDSFWTD